MIGEVLDHYRILQLIGRGAMGVVYQAVDVNLDRRVAIKVMSAEARSDPDFVERFRQEARAQGALNHPNVALLFDYFLHEGAPVAVMEFIDGESLEQLIRRRGAIPAHECIPLFRQALCGVAAAHRAGIIHRDLKPANLMVTSEGIVKVMDFGIAKRAGVSGATRFTSTSIGSPLYMAPEQILGRSVDCRTDIYALGVTLYELLAGQRPFNSRGKPEYLVLDAHVNEVPEPPTVYRYGIPQPIVEAVMRALAKDPNARFQSVEEFLRSLPDVPAPRAAAARDASATVALEYSPAMSGEDTLAPRVPGGTMVFDYSAATALQDSRAPRRAPASMPALAPADLPEARSVPLRGTHGVQRPRGHRVALLAALLASLIAGALLRNGSRGHPSLPAGAAGAPATQPPVVSGLSIPAEPTGPPAPLAERAAAAAEATVPPPPPRTAPQPVAVTAPQPVALTAPRQDVVGTWRGVYVDASGKPLLHVVDLSISHIRNDGGIEGTLRYQAVSGEGACRLHPRHSSWRAAEQRLQLSPEGCSPHYPKELGVPLDFEAVDPRSNTLTDGRIEAPSGEVVRVSLRRVGGV